MRNFGWKPGAGLVLAGGATVLCWACLHHEPPPPPNIEAGTAGCGVTAGQFPPANCDDTDESCTPPTGTCNTAPCTTGSACLAMADNGGKTVLDFRMRKLEVGAPAALRSTVVQGGVVDTGIKLANQCGEDGQGAFNWILRLDTTAMKITTGGAPPSMDPFGKGYCFVDEKIGQLMVTQATTTVTKNADGTYETATIPKLNVPIFVMADVTMGVVLPISQVKLASMTVSKDGNCIGSYNPNGAQSGTTVCHDNPHCARWFTGGSLGGYITLEEADGVPITLLGGNSLCMLLTNNSSVAPDGKHCLRDANGKIVAQGDYCSTTNMAGGCADSFWLAATFAASAAKINDGSGVPQCSGGLTGDGGTDGGEGGTDGSPGDAGDAATDAAAD